MKAKDLRIGKRYEVTLREANSSFVATFTATLINIYYSAMTDESYYNFNNGVRVYEQYHDHSTFIEAK